MPDHDQLAVVTGASSGVGQKTALLLAERGWHVLAGVRKISDGAALAGEHVEPVILDITDPAHIGAVVDRVASDDENRPLSVLVNNAGVALNAPIETLAVARWREHFEVNLFGHVAVTQALLAALLPARGRIVNISSIGGLVALPTYGPYAAAKFALEAFSDALRRELAPSGVSVIVIEPGTIATEIWGKQIAAMSSETVGWTEEQHERYDALMTATIQRAQSAGERGVSPVDAARLIVDAILAKDPQARYLIGEDAIAIAQARRDLSDREFDEMLAKSRG